VVISLVNFVIVLDAKLRYALGAVCNPIPFEPMLMSIMAA